MEKIWEYGGVDRSFDVSSSEGISALMAALCILRAENKNNGSEKKDVSAMVREHCMILRGFFDRIFGDGQGEEICGSEFSAEAHTLAYMDFITFVEREAENFRRAAAKIEEKYMDRVSDSDCDSEEE